MEILRGDSEENVFSRHLNQQASSLLTKISFTPLKYLKLSNRNFKNYGFKRCNSFMSCNTSIWLACKYA